MFRKDDAGNFIPFPNGPIDCAELMDSNKANNFYVIVPPKSKLPYEVKLELLMDKTPTNDATVNDKVKIIFDDLRGCSLCTSGEVDLENGADGGKGVIGI